jgi:hypothetical protein
VTSFRAMKTEQFKDGAFYRIACKCGSPECDLTLELEYDEELNYVFLNMYKTLKWSSYFHNGDKWYWNLWYRFKMAFKCLFFGYVEVEESFILDGKEHIDSFIKVLQDARLQVSKKEIELENKR